MEKIEGESDNITSSYTPNVKGTKKDEEDSEEKKKPAKKFFKRKNLSIIFTALIFVVTTLYTIFSYMQWKTMNEALNRADTSNAMTQGSIKLAKEQFTYKRKMDSINKIIQNKKDSLFAISQYKRDSINEKNAEVELRAYVWLDSVGFNNFNVNEKVSMYVGLINTGKTPAYDVTISAKWKIGETEGTGKWDIENNEPVPALILPQTKGKVGIIIYTRVILTQNDSINIMNGNIFVGCSGVAYYRDVFGHYDSLAICDYFFGERKRFVNCSAYAQNKEKWPGVIK